MTQFSSVDLEEDDRGGVELAGRRARIVPEAFAPDTLAALAALRR